MKRPRHHTPGLLPRFSMFCPTCGLSHRELSRTHGRVRVHPPTEYEVVGHQMVERLAAAYPEPRWINVPKPIREAVGRGPSLRWYGCKDPWHKRRSGWKGNGRPAETAPPITARRNHNPDLAEQKRSLKRQLQGKHRR